MRWIIHRMPDDGAVLTIELSRDEADEICKDLNTGDDSTTASKMAFGAFLKAATDKHHWVMVDDSGQTRSNGKVVPF